MNPAAASGAGILIQALYGASFMFATLSFLLMALRIPSGQLSLRTVLANRLQRVTSWPCISPADIQNGGWDDGSLGLSWPGLQAKTANPSAKVYRLFCSVPSMLWELE